MSTPAISVEGLGKMYRLSHQGKRTDSFREAVTAAALAPLRRLRQLSGRDDTMEEFWALKDVSFEVQPGEVVGIIGRNGAGKSTLLKVLSRIVEPTEGRAVLRGRVASLLEVGTGFHPELTGRENIYMNGSILGMKRREIAAKFDEIVAFAEVEKFLDTPVKRYSSGMYVRLAFAVAAHLDPQILIVDEVLAVGDAEFQKKCLGKMKDVSTGTGRTVLFVSHNMAAIESLCRRVIYLEAGTVVANGAPNAIIGTYLNRRREQTLGSSLASRTDRTGTGAVRLTGFDVTTPAGVPLDTIVSGHDIVFHLYYEVSGPRPVTHVDVGFSLSTMHDSLLMVLYSSYMGHTFTAQPGRGVFRCHVPAFPFAKGRYSVGARIAVSGVEADWPRDGIAEIDVSAGDFYRTGSAGFEGTAPLLVQGTWTHAADAIASRHPTSQEICR